MAVEPVPALVTLHVWRVPPSKVAASLARMALDRRRARRTPGVRFAKMLGTGSSFSLRDSDLQRWAKLSTWTTHGPDPVAASWAGLAEETIQFDLRPLASTGRWSGREPFGSPVPARHEGPVLALTRARLVPSQAVAFWRAVPPVTAALEVAAGLKASLAVGEAPLGLQGTVSLWDSAAALRAFAYDSPAHRQAITQTTRVGWYSEELFARFEVLDVRGTLDGKDLR